MRIAFLHQPNHPYAEARIKYFTAKGNEVFSIVFPKKIKQKTIMGVQIITLPDLLLNRIMFVKRFLYGMYIWKITKRNKIDVFHVISALNCFYLWSSKAKKNVLELQGSDVIITPNRVPVLKYYYKLFWRYADAIVQNSQIAKEYGMQYLPVRKIIINQTIDIGVDFKVYNTGINKGIIRNKLNLDNRFIVFHSRSIKHLYNLDIFFEALLIVKKRYNDVCYLLTGYINELSNKTVRFIKENKLEENIIFCGLLDHVSEMKYYYMDANLFVSIPSSDSSPFSVYEAMATKTPVIVSDLPWLKEKFIPGKHLLTVPVRNSSALAEMILKALNKEITLDIDSAYNIVYQKINMNIENEKLEKLFTAILDKN